MPPTEQQSVHGLVRGWGRWKSSVSERDTWAPTLRFGKRKQEEKEARGERERRRKSNEKGKKRGDRRRKKGDVKENRRGWTVPGVDHKPRHSKQSPRFLTSVLWMSFYSVNAKQLSRLRGSCKPPDKGTLCVCPHLPFS